MACVVRCPMHDKAVYWLRTGNVRALRHYLDVFDTMKERAWIKCTCDLHARIHETIKNTRI